jgi:hypothetical protein
LIAAAAPLSAELHAQLEIGRAGTDDDGAGSDHRNVSAGTGETIATGGQ